MSFFNEANELASWLIEGAGYQDAKTPLPKISELVFKRPGPKRGITIHKDSGEWPETASRVEYLLRRGYDCEPTYESVRKEL